MTTTPAESIWLDSPLLGLFGQAQTVQFQSQVKIWDDNQQTYVPLSSNNGVSVKVINPVNGSIAGQFTTNAVGGFSGSLLIKPGTHYDIIFGTSGLTFGSHSYLGDQIVHRSAKLSGGTATLIPPYITLPERISSDYGAFVYNIGFPTNIDYTWNKKEEIIDFEKTYSDTNTNILFEGDSWFDYPGDAEDIYDAIKAYLKTPAYTTKTPPAFLPLQRWGHESDDMLKGAPPSQLDFLKQYLSKYKISALLLSCGGNDFALHVDQFLKTPASTTLIYDAAYIASQHNLQLNFGLPGTYADAAAHVLAKVGSSFENMRFPKLGPPPLGDPQPTAFEDILDLVFDRTAIDNAFLNIEQNIYNLLIWMIQKGITTQVISHTYSYPIFNNKEVETTFKNDGPYLHPDFEAIGIYNKVLQTLCIKGLVDAFHKHVLKSLASSATTGPFFSYADLRPVGITANAWNDEMHLSTSGSRVAAWLLYYKLKARCPGLFP